ncbi:MAG: transposase [Bacteroidia bacterium]
MILIVIGCKTCPVRHLCTKNAIGRIIYRTQYQDTMDRNNARMINQKERYLRRQQIIEHPFGTIKRAWGYYFTVLKGEKKSKCRVCHHLYRI